MAPLAFASHVFSGNLVPGVSWYFVGVYFVPLVVAVVGGAALCDRTRLNAWSTSLAGCWVVATCWASIQFGVGWGFGGPRMMHPTTFAVAWGAAGLLLIGTGHLARRGLE